MAEGKVKKWVSTALKSLHGRRCTNTKATKCIRKLLDNSPGVPHRMTVGDDSLSNKLYELSSQVRQVVLLRGKKKSTELIPICLNLITVVEQVRAEVINLYITPKQKKEASKRDRRAAAIFAILGLLEFELNNVIQDSHREIKQVILPQKRMAESSRLSSFLQGKQALKHARKPKFRPSGNRFATIACHSAPFVTPRISRRIVVTGHRKGLIHKLPLYRLPPKRNHPLVMTQAEKLMDPEVCPAEERPCSWTCAAQYLVTHPILQ